MTTQAGTPIWNFVKKEKLTDEVIEAKAKEVTRRFANLLLAFGVAVNELADAADPLGLHCLATLTKSLLADGADRCAAAVQKVEIIG